MQAARLALFGNGGRGVGVVADSPPCPSTPVPASFFSHVFGCSATRVAVTGCYSQTGCWLIRFGACRTHQIAYRMDGRTALHSSRVAEDDVIEGSPLERMIKTTK